VAAPTVAYVSEQLGLPGPSMVAAETMASKHRFREFQKNARISCPEFLSGDKFAPIASQIHHLRPPILLKPVDNSGSRGVARVDRVDFESCKAAFLKAQDFSRSRTVCVEEFMPGIEVGGDAILINGHIAFIAITHKYLRDFVVTGHSLPTNISKQDQVRVMSQLEDICKALSYSSGPLNFDAIVAEKNVTILEMSARNGGNGIPAVIARATGVDVEQAAILLALGEDPKLPEFSEIKNYTGSIVFGSPKQGVLEHITSPDVLMREVPEIFDVFYAKKHGDHIEPFEHNGNFIGLALFDCNTDLDYECLSGRISSILNIIIKPPV
jgi:biotin carboxylase